MISSTVSRHSEINEFLVKRICKDLEIESPQQYPRTFLHGYSPARTQGGIQS